MNAHFGSETTPTEITQSIEAIQYPDGGTGSVVVLTASRPDGKPASLGPAGLANFVNAVEKAIREAQEDGHAAVVLTGVERTFLAGADLDLVDSTRDPELARKLGEAGHELIVALMDSPVPTVAFINGTSLGGGYEIALACRMRIARADVRAIGLPEVHLGLIPGWGGSYLLPHLIGTEKAVGLIVDNALRGKTALNAKAALELGLIDAVTSEDGFPSADIGALLANPPREAVPHSTDIDEDTWNAPIAASRGRASRAAKGGRPAPEIALELITAARTADRTSAFAAEDEALATLIATDALHDTLHAMNLLRAARPKRGEEQKVTSLGVIGGGLMATQLASTLSYALGIPAHLTEIDEERVVRTRELLKKGFEDLAKSPKAPPAEALEALAARITVGTDVSEFSKCDLVIEAVFEDMDVKRQVFANVEPHLREDAILATNTSALSITEMGRDLKNPERLVGIHFFNPVAQMPLVEIVRTASTSPEVAAAAAALVHGAGKTTVNVTDEPGFIVNRILVRMLGEVLASLEDGTSVEVAATALEPIGLPMGPLQLLQLVGPAVARHVLVTLHNELGERYRLSPGLDEIVKDGASFTVGPPTPAAAIDPEIAKYFPGSGGDDAQGVLHRVLHCLVDEINRMIEGGVASRDDIDVAMILGAGWPLHRGGITRHLDEMAEEIGSTVRFHS